MNSRAALIDQGVPGSEATLKRILQLLEDPKLERVRFAVAFARWDGIGLIASSLENFVSRGGRFESIFGAGNGITTPDALYYGILLRKLFPLKIYVDSLRMNMPTRPFILNITSSAQRLTSESLLDRRTLPEVAFSATAKCQ